MNSIKEQRIDSFKNYLVDITNKFITKNDLSFSESELLVQDINYFLAHQIITLVRHHFAESYKFN